MRLLLVDNGSLEPAPTLALREVAAKLTALIGQTIAPVSLLHSDKVSADELGGTPAEIIETVLRRGAAKGESDFGIMPFFVGPSRAITEYLPALVTKLRQDLPAYLRLKVAPPLYQAGDDRLAQILADRVHIAKRMLGLSPGEAVRVALVDHGSPVSTVTAVRDALAVKLAGTLGTAASAVAPCSMERRPGPAYAFNEPLLEQLLARERWNSGPVIVAQLFLSLGRHAGPGGDVAQICARAEAASPTLRTVRTEVLGTHPRLIEILADRLTGIAGSRGNGPANPL